MTSTFGTEDFIIEGSHKNLVERHIEKIQRLFGVKISFDYFSSEGADKKQWIVVSGYKEKRKSAKNYIIAMCHPEQKHYLSCTGNLPLDDLILEGIEQDTSAVLKRTGLKTLEAMGSELSCAMAFSKLEQFYQVTMVSKAGLEPHRNSTSSSQKESQIALTPSPSGMSHQEEVLHVDDTTHNQPDGVGSHKPCAVIVKEQACKISLHNDDVKADFDGPSAVAEQQKANLSELAKGFGYSEEEVQEALQFFDLSRQTVQQSEFFSTVDAVRSRRQSASATHSLISSPKSNKGKQYNSPMHRKMSKLKGSLVSSEIAPLTIPSQSSTLVNGESKSQRENGEDSDYGGISGQVSRNDSVVFMGEDLDKSVVFMGENLDRSVCIVDPFSQECCLANASIGSSHSSQMIGCKRKDFSDDEDQTHLLKLYSCDEANDVAASHYPKQQDVAFTTDASSGGTTGAEAAAADDLRFIVIDGSNVAMSHGNDKVYSCKGIKICVDYFVKRGHRVKAWVPLTKSYRNQPGRLPPIKDQHILEELKDQGYLSFTPARKLNNRHIVNHDDYFILNLAKLEDAVIVTKDNFKEFVKDYRDIIENRLLHYVFSDDHFMLPEDPLGRFGPTLEEFLRKTPSSSSRGFAKDSELVKPSLPSTEISHFFKEPNKSKFGQLQSRLEAQHLQGFNPSISRRLIKPGQRPAHIKGPSSSKPQRHPDTTRDLLAALKGVFPNKDQEEMIQLVLDNHSAETDLDKLCNYCFNALTR